MTTINPEDSLLSIAREYLGSSDRWREIADLNGFNPLEALPTGSELKLPSQEQILNFAKPALSQIAGGRNNALSAVLQQLPISEYAEEAQKLIGEVNGVLGEVESVVSGVWSGEGRDYAHQGVQLIDWLLS